MRRTVVCGRGGEGGRTLAAHCSVGGCEFGRWGRCARAGDARARVRERQSCARMPLSCSATYMWRRGERGARWARGARALASRRAVARARSASANRRSAARRAERERESAARVCRSGVRLRAHRVGCGEGPESVAATSGRVRGAHRRERCRVGARLRCIDCVFSQQPSTPAAKRNSRPPTPWATTRANSPAELPG